MVVACPVCRSLVHIVGNYLARHGSRIAGRFVVCTGSGQSYIVNE